MGAIRLDTVQFARRPHPHVLAEASCARATIGIRLPCEVREKRVLVHPDLCIKLHPWCLLHCGSSDVFSIALFEFPPNLPSIQSSLAGGDTINGTRIVVRHSTGTLPSSCLSSPKASILLDSPSLLPLWCRSTPFRYCLRVA